MYAEWKRLMSEAKTRPWRKNGVRDYGNNSLYCPKFENDTLSRQNDEEF